MIKNPSFHLNQFIKWASWCHCPGDGVFLIKINNWVPTLSNISWDDLWFPTSSYLKRFIKSMWVTLDGIYWFRINNEDVMFENILNCPTPFESSPESETFFYNTNDCTLLDDWFYWMQVSWCNATYIKIFDDWNCWLTAPTWITNNEYTCGDVTLSWDDVDGAQSYIITDWVNTRTTSTSMIIIPYSSNGNTTYSVKGVGIAWEWPSSTLVVDMVNCAITWLSNNWYVYGDLTLTWDADPTATYYEVSYGATTTTVTDETITIPYTVWGNITYRVKSCNVSGCSIATSTTVTMMQPGVSWINNWWYSCGDMTLTWTAVVWANEYSISYWSPIQTFFTSNTTYTVPLTTLWSRVYTISAWNSNWFNLWSTYTTSMNSCGVSNLSSNDYTCGDLTLSWDAYSWATQYTISYGSTSITQAWTSVTIPYTADGNVTYSITPKDSWWTSLITSTIVVNMQTCYPFIGNIYTWNTTDTSIVLTSNPTSLIGNTTIYDTLDTWDVAGYPWKLTAKRIEQNPYSKKIHYMTPNWLYVWNMWSKSVTLVSTNTNLAKPWYNNLGITLWLDTVEQKLYKWTDSSVWTLWQTFISYPTFGPPIYGTYHSVNSSPDWRYVIVAADHNMTRLTLTNWTTGGTWYSQSLQWPTWQPQRDSVNQSWVMWSWHQWLGMYFYRYTVSWASVRIWSSEDRPSSPTVCWSTVSEIRDFKVYGGKIYYTVEAPWSETVAVIDSGYYKPDTQRQTWMIDISSWTYTYFQGSWLNRAEIASIPIWTSGTTKYYMSRWMNWSMYTAPLGYIYLYWSLMYSDWALSHWLSEWAIIKVNLDLTYWLERTHWLITYPWTVCSWSNNWFWQVFTP